jgi:hypothetical protein
MNPLVSLGLKALVVIAFAALAIWTGGPLVNWVFDRVDTSAAKKSGDQTTPPASLAAAGKRLGGGQWIGMLERLGIFASFLSGFGEGVAIVLAIKSLARYPELRAPSSGAAERFIIGTFTSAIFAGACAGACWWIIDLW